MGDLNGHAARPAGLVRVDLSIPDFIEAAADQLAQRVGHLDALINNSAVFDQTLREPVFTDDGHELFWVTNQLGPLPAHRRAQPTARRRG
ncbi:MAG: hypothetical protein HOV79_01145, partial [Hamadaea sp.]|nr:hypothetical protein [Hamadaea sp.]